MGSAVAGTGAAHHFPASLSKQLRARLHDAAEELELRLQRLDAPLPAKTRTRRNLFAFPETYFFVWH